MTTHHFPPGLYHALSPGTPSTLPRVNLVIFQYIQMSSFSILGNPLKSCLSTFTPLVHLKMDRDLLLSTNNQRLRQGGPWWRNFPLAHCAVHGASAEQGVVGCNSHVQNNSSLGIKQLPNALVLMRNIKTTSLPSRETQGRFAFLSH